MTAGKKAIILSAHDDNGRRIKSSLKPMGSDNIGWYYADADDADAIREIADDTSRKLDDCKSRIERDWDALVAEGKQQLGKAADQFVYPERDEYISRASFIVKVRNGSINFKDSAFDALGAELAASLRAEQQIEQEQLVESHRAGVDAFFSNVADQVSKIEASLKKGKRLRPEGFETLLNEARDLQQDNWLGDSNINAISSAFEAVLRSVESFPALSRSERRAKAKEIRQTTVDSIEIAKSIGL